MEIKHVWGVYYSAVGSTEKLVKALASTLAECLNVPVSFKTFNTPEEREAVQTFEKTDLLVVGTPTYAGKIPNKLLPTFRSKMVGDGALAVALVSFGNRSYDNSLAELCSVLEQNGFCLVGGAACVAQHAMAKQLAAGRPDEKDFGGVRSFAQNLADKLQKAHGIQTGLRVPGDADAPYYVPLDEHGQPANFLKAKPKTLLEKCVKCGDCVRVCPMGSIDPLDVSHVTGICIKCQACIQTCTAHAKYFDDPAYLSHVAMLTANYTSPKQYEFFTPDLA